MKYLIIIFLCILSIVLSFFFFKIIPKKTEKSIVSSISMFFGLVFYFASVYLILQFGKRVDAYEQTVACIVVTTIVMEILENVFGLFD